MTYEPAQMHKKQYKQEKPTYMCIMVFGQTIIG